ncbi:unnamed protein product, partial [Vitis vinifera]
MYEEKPSIRCLKVAEVDDAVELSIAASEALVIHELLKSESPSEAFPAAAVLEVALRVKQARLEMLEDSVHHPIEEVDFLSDLVDSAMEDVFEDVGLFDVGSHDQCSGGSIMSRVEDTPISGNHCGFDDKSKHVDPGAQNVDSDDISIQNQPEEILDEVGVSVLMKQANPKSIPKLFVGETSFLSESADVAPDENSFVPKNETSSKLASQSSIPFEGLCDKANEEILLSQVQSSSLSLVDPLCSVVPCSISLENDGSAIDQNQNDKEVDAENCFSPTLEVGKGDMMQRASGIFPCISSGRSDFTELLPFTSMSKYAISRDYEYNHDTSVHMPKKGNSPLILNQRMHYQLQASKHFINNSSGEENSKGTAVPDIIVGIQQSKNLEMPQPEFHNAHSTQVQIRKRVRFSEANVQHPQNKNLHNIQTAYKTRKTWILTHKVKWYMTNCCINEKLIFQGLEFLLTGFSSCKEKEIEGLIRKYGGIVLPDIPSPSNSRRKRNSNFNQKHLPIVLCSKKLQTTKFLYGCAVNTFMLKVDWLNNSVAAGSVLPPGKYMILSNEGDKKRIRIGMPIHRENHKYIFEKVGIMLHGKHSFCSKFAKIFRHGGGQVFKTLQCLVQSLDTESISVGAIVAEDESRASRHLRLCASERKIPMMPASWIINSLHLGRLLPLTENKHSSPLTRIMVQELPTSMEFSAEI